MVLPAARHSMLARAEEAGIVEFIASNPREFAYDQHRKVDDRVYGGGPGMLMKAEPVALALEFLEPSANAAIVITDPAGDLFVQETARELSAMEEVFFLCGHYEGFDHRVNSFATHRLSIGDYVLTGGELPALVMADAIVRLLPGVLGSAESLSADSFSGGLLSAPNYTRPEVWRGLEVPEVLLSGDHAKVAAYQRDLAERATRERG
jgi:tRNA (guanine37-N1)-methyltransferase